MIQFVHLHAHSYYSFLEGVASPKELANHAAVNGLEALALTDSFGMTGAILFYEACLEEGIQPILGLELPVNHTFGKGNLIFLAQDMKGWGNLCRLSSALQTLPGRDWSEGIQWEGLELHHKGLYCLTGGKKGLLTRLVQGGELENARVFLRNLRAIFLEDLYIELQIDKPADHLWCGELAKIGDALGISTVATHDIHTLTPDQMEIQRTLAAIRMNCQRTEIPEEALPPTNAYFVSPDEMMKHFSKYPGAVERTVEIASHCRFELELGNPRFPEIPVPVGETTDSYLKKLALTGAKKIYGQVTSEIQDRLNYELGVIRARGYGPLFLIMQDVLTFAREAGVPTSSRGSAASSLVAHCLGITSPDPLSLNLYFERFLNPARKSPPDIDTDLCSVRRDKVIQYVYEKFGADRVAMVATINHFRRRSALREVAKVYGLSESEIKSLADQLPYRGWGPSNRLNGSQDHPYQDLLQRYKNAPYPRIFRDAEAVLKIPRHLSIHPGGIVIAPGPINDIVPTRLASKGIVITQFDLEGVEKIGLVKIDLLGTRGLSVLGDLAEQIFEWRKSEFKKPLDVLEAVPQQDEKTSALVESAQTIGCFQIESPGMRITLREINARTPEDIMIALALYRPGPLTGGLKDAFVRRHLGKEPVKYLHPTMGTLLQNTYGVILYQEQVLRLASVLAGLSLADADLLRRAMSHFDPGERMKTLQRRFIEGANKKSGIPPPLGEQIWELMAAFAGYGFPKAHAASYAQVAWQSAWCKAHFPAEFMAAVLANWGGYYRQPIYLNEVRRLRVSLKPPHVNHSSEECRVVYPKGEPIIFIGLNQVRELTRRTQKRIMTERPFHSFYDFLIRVDPRIKEAENLVMVGGLDGFGTIPELLSIIKTGGWRYGQPTLFDLDFNHQPGIEDWDLQKRVSAQHQILGVGIDAHPLELLPDKKQVELNSVSSITALEYTGQVVRVLGYRETLQRVFGHKGDPYYVMEIEDREGTLPVIMDRGQILRFRPLLSGHSPLVVEGEIMWFERLGQQVMVLQRLWRFD